VTSHPRHISFFGTNKCFRRYSQSHSRVSTTFNKKKSTLNRPVLRSYRSFILNLTTIHQRMLNNVKASENFFAGLNWKPWNLIVSFKFPSQLKKQTFETIQSNLISQTYMNDIKLRAFSSLGAKYPDRYCWHYLGTENTAVININSYFFCSNTLTNLIFPSKP
jgi:hypothetical protein